jgi:nicotinamide-nucleotide amidase
MYRKTDVKVISEHLLKMGHSIAVAESVTAGHLQAAISLADDASSFFQGGITTYNLGQKSRHLQIEPIHAEACNCVSEQVATEMSLNVTKLFSSNWGIGITGYAAPVPECDVIIPYAFCAISFNGKVMLSKRVKSNTTSGRPSQEYYVERVLKELSKLVRKKN